MRPGRSYFFFLDEASASLGVSSGSKLDTDLQTGHVAGDRHLNQSLMQPR